MVAGTVALMMQANPNLTPNLAKAIIEYTAQDYGYGKLTQGAGFLNSEGAVKLARYLYTAEPGSVYPTNSAWAISSIIWGNRKVKSGVIKQGSASGNVVWGANVAEGDNIVWGTHCDRWTAGASSGAPPASKPATSSRAPFVRGDNIVWGTNDGEDDNIVWGTACGDDECDNIVWGTECGGGDCQDVVWGTACNGNPACRNIVWGTACDGNDECDNIVWGTACDQIECDNIVWGTACAEAECDNIVWGTACADAECDNIVWGTSDGDAPPMYDDPDAPAAFDDLPFESLFFPPVPEQNPAPPITPGGTTPGGGI